MKDEEYYIYEVVSKFLELANGDRKIGMSLSVDFGRYIKGRWPLRCVYAR